MEEDTMMISRFVSALALMLVSASPALSQTGLEQLAEGPVKFNVKVEVSSLLPDVFAVNVTCGIWDKPGGQAVLSGQNSHANLIDGAFSGVLTVGMKFATGRSSLDLGPQSIYECYLLTVNKKGDVSTMVFWNERDATESNEVELWMKRKPGSVHVGVIRGPFPPTPTGTLKQ
jgi:hypothetical protein